MPSEVINGVTWNIHSNGTITSASGYGSNVIVPDTVDSITVVGFSNDIFKNQSTIQTISIPDSVTSLPQKFFGDNNNNTLTSVTFTENSQLTTIGQSALKDCFILTDFKIPSTVTTFSGTHQFQATAMSSVTIPAGLAKLDQGVFYNMPNLTELIFAPNSNLDEFAQGYEFTNCNKLDVIINFPAQNFPNDSKFSSNSFHNIGPNPVVILSGETTDAQADAFINDTDMTDIFKSSPQENGVTFYKRPLTNQNVVDLYATLSIAQLYTVGSTVTQLQTAGATVAEIYAAGATVAELYAAGITVAELQALNITVAELYAAGATVAELYAAGITVAELVAINITKEALLAANVPEVDIDIAQMNIKIHSDFTISDGTNSSAFIKGEVYTTTSFTSKLTTDLNNTVTVGGKYTTTDGTNYYRIYLEFANAVTLTGMPKYIFNILDNTVYVEAGGQVNFRNVNLDADMTFNVTRALIPQSQIGEDIVGLVAGELSSTCVKLNNDGTIFFSSSTNYNSLGRIISYKYKIPTTTEWSTANIVKGTDTSQVPDKYYWTQRGADITGNKAFGYIFDIDDTGNFIVVSARQGDETQVNGSVKSKTGTLRVYEYKIPTSTEWSNADIYKDSDANQVSGKFYWTQVGNTIYGDNANDQWGRGVTMNSDGSRISWGTRSFVDSNTWSGRVKVYQRDLSNTQTGWTQLGGTILKEPFDNEQGGYGDTLRLNDVGDVILVTDRFYRYTITGGNTLQTGKNWVYKYKIPTTAEWNDTNSLFVMKGDDENQVTDKLYWTKIGEFSPGFLTDTVTYGEGYAMNKTGSIIALTGRYADDGVQKGQLEVFEYSGSGTTWTQIAYITGTGYDGPNGSVVNDQEGISGGSGNISHFSGASIAMNPTGNIIALHTTAYDYDQALSNLGMTVFMEYKNNAWQYFGNVIKGLNANDKLGNSLSMGGNKVALGSSAFDGTDGTTGNIGMAQVHQIEIPAISHTSTIPDGNHFINNFVSKLDTDISSFSLSYDGANNSIVVGDISTDISFSITSADTTIFDTSITEMTNSTNTLPFITYGQPEPNYNNEGVEFIDTIQIKIHNAFTISDGTNSSAFATTDAVYTPITFAAKLTTDLNNTVTEGGDFTTTDTTPYYRLYLQFANAVTLTGMPKDIFNIPFSDFSVKAGGQVNLRNVNLDAAMTINTNYIEYVPFGLMTGDIDDWVSYGRTAISGDGNRIASCTSGGSPSYTGGSLTSGGGGNGFGQINIYERDTNAASGWTQLGETIWGGCANENFGQNLSMSHDGEIVVAGSQRNSINYTGDLYDDVKHVNESLRGYFQAWKRDASSTVNPVGWVKYGNAIVGKVHQDRGFYVRISGDGNSIVAKCRSRVNYVEVYKYSTPGQTGGTWDLQGNTFNGNTTSGHDDYYLSMNLSYDGNILAIGNSTYNSNNGRVQVYQRDTNAATGWTQLGSDIIGTGGEQFGGSRIDGATNLIIADNGNKLAVMSENYSNAQNKVVGRVSIYKRDTNVALGWSLIGNPIENPISTEKNFDTMDISEDGNRVVIGISDYVDGNITNAGRSYVYDYNSTTLAWEHIITNNQTSSTDPITGTSNDDYLSAIVISADGFKQAVRRNGKIYTYQLPNEVHGSNTSTIPAGNHYINQFVSTIETDLVNFPLSYDESTNAITFDGLVQDISINITSNDTTIFDTSITEITTTANTLPFITYGQPDPILRDYGDYGITTSEFVSNGYTIQQLLSGSFIPDWNFVTDANHFDQSYVKGFTDVSGCVVIRNDNRLMINGDLSLGGNLTIHNYPPPYTVIQTPTNNLLTSQYLMDAGHIFNGSYGAIPTTDIDTTAKADSLTTITVTSVDMVGDMGSINVPSNARICKYVDGGGNEIVGDWIAGRWDGTYTRMAKIRFTLVGNTVSVKWVERGLANTDQTDSDINLLSGWNNGTITTAYRHVITNLVFTTTYTETITYPPNGTTSLVIDDMTLKSRLFMGEDITANGNVNIGGDLSVNGQFSGDFANGIIPQSAIVSGDTNISGHVYFADDVSFNGSIVDVTNTLQVNQIEFNDGTTVSTHDDNILSGTFAGSNVVFKDSTFAAITCEGTATAATVTQSSDYRIKENVTELNETDTVDAVVPIQYNNTLSGNHEFGLLAHELQEIYPDLVNGEKDGDEYQRVNYNGLIGVLVKEVQDLKQRLAALNNL